MSIHPQQNMLKTMLPAIRRHLEENLAAPIESFLEDHIHDSTHYRLLVDGDIAGLASVYDKTLLTMFSVEKRFRPIAAQLFTAARQLESVTTAFVPTCDELYLSCALDVSTKVEKQAYVWQVGEGVVSAENLRFVRATSADYNLITHHTADFFGDVPTIIQNGNLYIGYRNSQPVGFGLIEPSRFYPATASIGMFTIEQHREQGVGTNLIRALIDECQRREWRAVAGCYYYNYASQYTLTKAGMYSQTRLLKIHF